MCFCECYMGACNTPDKGIEYGVSVEFVANTDEVTAADEAWAFVESDAWGRIEMGDQDDAMDRMHVEGDDVLVGRAGYDGDIDDFITFGSGRGIFASGPDATDDAPKITYFTPRFAGFQVGRSDARRVGKGCVGTCK